MTDPISLAAEEWFGIKADPGDVKRLQAWLCESYGGESSDILRKVFSSGEAAAFLTVNETYFFREPLHFTFLLDLLPVFQKSSLNPSLRICSDAVATGCEAYSIAMLIEAYNRARILEKEKPLSYHIDAFDINPKVIEAACQGLYNPRSLREDGSSFHYMANPYLKKLGTSAKGTGQRPEGVYLVDSSLRENIRFFVHNLMNEIHSINSDLGYDLIFFRNAFIYFTPQNRGRILSNLSAALKDGGILMMGVSETAGANPPDMEAKNKGDVFYFQKPL